MTRVLGRLGVWVAAATAVSCIAFLALPLVAAAGAPLLIARSNAKALPESGRAFGQ